MVELKPKKPTDNKYPLPGEADNVPKPKDIPTDYPYPKKPEDKYPQPNSNLEKAFQEHWNRKHHTGASVNIRHPRVRNKRSNR